MQHIELKTEKCDRNLTLNIHYTHNYAPVEEAFSMALRTLRPLTPY